MLCAQAHLHHYTEFMDVDLLASASRRVSQLAADYRALEGSWERPAEPRARYESVL